MPRRKRLPKVPDYEGVPNDESKLVVQKSNPLQSLSETDMTLAEFKLLDAYLSRIDSHDEEKRYVRFEKGELEQILGVSRILKNDLEKRLKNLFQVVTIQDPDKPKGFTMIALFEKAEASQDQDGLWQVDLACTPSAMEYVFNIDAMGYLPYMLKNVIELTSRYSYILYLYLEKNRWRKTWTEDIDELKAMLHCSASRYNEYKFFNSEVLKKCYKELNEKTTLKYTYEPTARKGRKYTAIKFTLQTRADLIEAQVEEEELEQITLELPATQKEKEIAEIIKIAENMEPAIMLNMREAAEIYHSYKLAEQSTKINNKTRYLEKTIENYKKESSQKEVQGSFDTDEFFEAALKHTLEKHGMEDD